MRLVEFIDTSALVEAQTIASPKEGARRFGRDLAHLFWDRHGYDNDLDDVINYEYLDDAKDHGLRYRYIVGPNYYKFLNEMLPQITAAGWHLTAETKRGHNRWQLVFEPTLAAKTPRSAIFWHLTPQRNVEAILATGIEPRTSRHGLRYPQPRIYLLRDGKTAHIMADSFAQRDKKPIAYAAIEVDLRRAKGINLHIDPELREVAVYTTQPIPPQFLSLDQELVQRPSL